MKSNRLKLFFLLKWLHLFACRIFLIAWISGRSREVYGVLTKTPFEILCTLVVKFKYSNRAVRSRLSNRTVIYIYISRYSIAVTFIRNNVWERKESKIGEREKRDYKSCWPSFFFALNFCLITLLKPPFENSRSATVNGLVNELFTANNSQCMIFHEYC